MAVTGSCHCGATRFEVSEAPASVTRCNCTFCSKRGGLWAYYRPEQFKLLASDRSTLYQRSGSPVKHHHCAVCGCGTYMESPAWVDFKPHPTLIQIGINARLLDDFDLEPLPVRFIDGKNLW